MGTLKDFLRGGGAPVVGEDSMLRFCYCLALFSSGMALGPDLLAETA